MAFLPTTVKEARQRGWDSVDVVLFTGDAYIDHPAFGAAVIGRLLEAEGYRVAVVPQPNWRDDLRDFRKFGTPRLFIASSCLNSTVSGLLSRTFLRGDIIGPGDFHGAAFYRELKDQDLTYQFIDTIQAHFPACADAVPPPRRSGRAGLEEVHRIGADFGIRDINLIKPSIGEATRVLLRRVPWKVLVHSLRDEAHLGHIYQLAREKGAELVEYPLENYRACGLIRDLADT